MLLGFRQLNWASRSTDCNGTVGLAHKETPGLYESCFGVTFLHLKLQQLIVAIFVCF